MSAARSQRIAIIDADSLLYATSLSAEMCAKGQDEGGGDLWFQVRGLDDCYNEVQVKFENRLEAIDADDAIICLSDRRCFRYSVLPSYKSNRVRLRRPVMMAHLVDACKDRAPFKVLAVDDLEADDLVGITGTSLREAGRDAIMVSQDKDLLTVPGVLHRKDRTFTISLEEADRAHMYQTLVGDYVDGYDGLPGVGTKRANAILDSAESPSAKHLWLATLAAFEARGHSQDVALTMARVARILRSCDWDAQAKKVRLWKPPT